MGQVEKAASLYSLMAERCERTGFAPEQARVYREMSQLVSGCSSIEESQGKIKNSKYYLAPTEALVRDKILAEKKAAIDLDMPEVAKVYDDKLAKIDANQGEMYAAGFEQTAQNIRSEYVLTVQAFAEIFRAYACYVCDENEAYLGEIRTNLSILKKPTSDFIALAGMEKFRKLTKCSDAGYERFVNDIEVFIGGGKIQTANAGTAVSGEGTGNCEETAESAWAEAQALKSEVIAAGKAKPRFGEEARAVAVAPTYSEYARAVGAGEKPSYNYEEVAR